MPPRLRPRPPRRRRRRRPPGPDIEGRGASLMSVGTPNRPARCPSGLARDDGPALRSSGRPPVGLAPAPSWNGNAGLRLARRRNGGSRPIRSRREGPYIGPWRRGFEHAPRGLRAGPAVWVPEPTSERARAGLETPSSARTRRREPIRAWGRRKFRLVGPAPAGPKPAARGRVAPVGAWAIERVRARAPRRDGWSRHSSRHSGPGTKRRHRHFGPGTK